jgi:hypothetical protein
MNKLDELSSRETGIILMLVVFSIGAVVHLYGLGHLELVPSFVFGFSTAGLGLLAYQFSKAKFRLDLYEKRWIIYENLVQFLSLMQQTGSSTPEVMDAAQGCFRGKGYHKARTLFGNDIIELFDRLNNTFSWRLAFDKNRNNLVQEDWARVSLEHDTFIDETIRKLPEYFRSYIYFGDYKR